MAIKTIGAHEASAIEGFTASGVHINIELAGDSWQCSSTPEPQIGQRHVSEYQTRGYALWIG